MATSTMKWTPEADLRLLLAVIAIHGIKIDTAKVGEVLGVTGKAITHRIAKLKEKAGKEINVDNPPAPVVAKPRAKKGTGKATKTAKVEQSDQDAGDVVKKEKTKSKSPVKDEKEEDEANVPTTPNGKATKNTPLTTPKQKVITGRVTKARTSPRKTPPISYKDMNEPLPGMDSEADVDQKMSMVEDGSSEDSADSDGEYQGKPIKTET
ncbi:MAG: hypothetical protein M1817_003694 [Caeruleum heppii]|nr:MAG: hypothetical protein M1817_003694 [Caeruleum heppii]